jgi:hypothetical protein
MEHQLWRTHRYRRERTVGHGHPLGQHGFPRYHGGQACTATKDAKAAPDWTNVGTDYQANSQARPG